ncbi:MAG: hypothetical protein BAJALOKI1v1_2150005 [Promethearchaeota archaeon]|nr:MAG: hypothetical protein BAJALOKI1v1_2150005 [Candidatus Lokiarchaeota archaeon]
MTNVVSTRLEEEEIKELNKISEEERLDRSSLIRKFLLIQMKEYRMKGAAEKYRKGLVSLAEAASIAKVSLYEMMDYVDRERIQAPALTTEEMEEELRHSKELFEKLRNKNT